MSWKSTEMQVALPRTQDAGKLQDQLMRQGQHFQESLSQSRLKEQELNRKRVNDFEDVQGAVVEKDREHSKNEDTDAQERQKNEEEDSLIDHPYLGRKFDLSR
ncbi:hypothetical protein ACLIBG_01395 [Virgibacillus sp. W0181]|uniref:hypothetical protein n=1 Tax=Virgibacillus sp. W0181 TaxID=3391581 RepID=UPI003F48A842